MKICLIGLASYCPDNIEDNDPGSLHRQELYAIALNQLLKISPNEIEIFLVDNTVKDQSYLSNSLQVQFSDKRIRDVMFTQNNQLGAKNKGAGENIMCRAVLNKYKNHISQFDWVVYYTSRHIMSFPLIFDYLKRHKKKEAIVSCADYINTDDTNTIGSSGSYDDVIFAMKPHCFYEYIYSVDPSDLTKHQTSSEACLYNFISVNGIDFQRVYRWGLLRYDWSQNKSQII